MLPFEGLRVVEVGSGTALAFCGKLFSDFGAVVVKVEAPGGDPGRRSPPLVAVDHERHESAYFAWLNTNKQSVTADLASDEGLDHVRRLVSGSDVLLDARLLSDLESPPAPLSAAVPDTGLVEVILTWFGETGPYRDHASTEAVCRALAGVIYNSGAVDGPPLIPHDSQSGIVGGLAAFSAAAAGCFGSDKQGRRYVISLQEALLHLVEVELGIAMDGGSRPRGGVNRFGAQHPASIYRTKDGWIGIFIVTASQWRALCKVLGRPEWGFDARFQEGPQRRDRADEVDAFLASSLATRSAAEWFELCAAERLPVVVVPTMQELLAQEVHRGRSAFVPVQIGSASFEGPILPQRMGNAGPLHGGRAPMAGEHNGLHAVASVHARPSIPVSSAPTLTRELPLKGVRIVDLTMGWAGPFATRHLADLGAEIIKIESITYPDWWRGTSYTEAYYSDRLYEKATYFNMMNRNKLGITLDLTDPEGVDLLKKLVSGAHAVIDNYSAEVLPKLGLDYAELRKVHPGIVMVSMPAFGSNNAWSKTRAYGGTLEQASGLPSVSGFDAWPPTMTSYAYGDPIGGYNAAAALLIGLFHQKRTGEGRFVDMSQVEGMLSLVAPSIIEQSTRGGVGPRIGNRHPEHSPHGCFRCLAVDSWVVIAVTNDAQWKSVCAVMGRADLAGDGRFETIEGRRSHAEEIESAIGAWTIQHAVDDAMTLLQSARVPAGAVRSIPDLLHESHLAARGFWRPTARPFSGNSLSAGTFYREDGESAPIRRQAPTLGQHNREVLGEMLGLSEGHLDALEDRGVIGTRAVPKGYRSPQQGGSA